MKHFFSNLWNEPDYFRKVVVFLVAFIPILLSTLPLGELGELGYWLEKVALPTAIALGATAKGSGISKEEAMKLRALIPTQEILDKKAPRI